MASTKTISVNNETSVKVEEVADKKDLSSIAATPVPSATKKKVTPNSTNTMASSAKSKASAITGAVPLPVTSTSTSTPMSTGSKRSSTTPGSTKKRPYRRTKRPKNYCDKSTVTTTTAAVHTPVNVYDAVLGECEDLLQASLEAQQLGRLKIASAYQLLLHTRLVGLGKRFDRATIMAPQIMTNSPDDDIDDDVPNGHKRRRQRMLHDDSDYDEEHHHKKAKSGARKILTDQDPPFSAISMKTEEGLRSPSGNLSTPTGPKNLPPALQQLTSILPSNLEMDSTMMEHLARAAVELHHQRTGRKKSADGLLASPMTGMIGSPSSSKTAPNQKSASSAAKRAKGAKEDATKVAWTAEEQETVLKAQKEKKATYVIAKMLPNKTEPQVKAFLKNHQKQTATSSALADEMASPNSKKRGGRGRKPPTTAMNTVPNANLDAKSLLKGFLHKR